jgi:anti-sigma regulatory factor (Ser/Thr protein kinase)
MARRYAHARLFEWGISPGDRDSIELVVSELVTNAIVHGGGDCVCLHLQRTPGSVYAYVWDASPEPPVIRDLDGDAETGRGLLITQELSLHTGYYHEWDGKTVWAECAVAASNETRTRTDTAGPGPYGK